MLHLTNGDAAAVPLRASGVPGDVIVWPDVLHEGPTPPEHGATWRHVRATYLSAAGYRDFDEILRRYDAADRAVERYREHDELVLWFEHDLFDQLLLARHLHWLGTQGYSRTRVSLVCIDRFPGIDPFHGLGQLSPGQLASLFPQRQPVIPEVLHAGADVWRAFTDGDPRALQAIVTYGMPALPFMAGALVRHLEEFPGARDGLSRTERTILQALAADARPPADLFSAVAANEERVFMGDLSFWRVVRGLARGPEPLVTIDIRRHSEDRLPEGLVAQAPAGRRVLAGEVDAVTLRGIDRWLGGVRLLASDASLRSVWRWDPARRALVPPGLT